MLSAFEKGPEEPVFLLLKKGVRTSLNASTGNASVDRDEIIPRGAVFLLLKNLAFHICEHEALAIWQMHNKVILKAEHHLLGISLRGASQSRRESLAFSLLSTWGSKSLGSILSQRPAQSHEGQMQLQAIEEEGFYLFTPGNSCRHPTHQASGAGGRHVGKLERRQSTKKSHPGDGTNLESLPKKHSRQKQTAVVSCSLTYKALTSGQRRSN